MAEGLSLPYSSNTNIFLKIDGVDGESVAKGHTKEIEVISWSWSGGNPASFDMGTGGSLGRVKLDQLRIVKPVDRSSPILWSFLCRHFYPEKAVLTCLKASGARCASGPPQARSAEQLAAGPPRQAHLGDMDRGQQRSV